MRLAVRLAAAGIIFVGTVVWLFGGPNLGWTRTSMARETIDPTTGLLQVVTERTFLPGADFEVAVLAVGALVFAGSFLCRPPDRPA